MIQTKIPGYAVADLTQEVFTSLVERRDKLREGTSVRAYIMLIARRAIADYYRRRRFETSVDRDIALETALGVSTDRRNGLDNEAILARHDSWLLLEALRELSLEDQLLLDLFYWEGLTGPELAQALETTEPLVRSKLRRAKKQLSAKLADLTKNDHDLGDSVIDLDAWAQRLRDAVDDED